MSFPSTLFISVPQGAANPSVIDLGKFSGAPILSAKLVHTKFVTPETGEIGIKLGNLPNQWVTGIGSNFYYHPDFLWLDSASDHFHVPIHLFGTTSLPQRMEIYRITSGGTASTCGVRLWIELATASPV